MYEPNFGLRTFFGQRPARARSTHGQHVRLVVTTDDQVIVVWHRTDLRIEDNPALNRAAALARAEAATIQPVFVFDPRFYSEKSLTCDGRIGFLHECLASLRERYRKLGSELPLLYGSPANRFAALLDEPNAEYLSLCYTRHPTARYGARRDARLETRIEDRIRTADHQHGHTDIEAVPEGAIVFDARERGIDSREGWAEQCQAYLCDEPHPSPDPDVLVSETNAPASDVTIEEIETRYGIESMKEAVPRGSHRAAHRRLNWFARAKTIGQYPGGISPPAEAERRTSRLSPYLRFGVLSVRQVYRAAIEHGGAERARDLFESRLYWNRHFRQKLADNPSLTEEAVNPVLRNLYTGDDERDRDLIAAWKNGRTGFPMVDASMRALTETGWLNFRMRAMVASFFGYILKQWWRIGADFMYYHLIDADPAINYAQWQMQCGLVGCHPNRIYNPRKQARENDADGEFIRKYVPELGDLPSGFLARPERTPVHIQRERETTIGDGSDADYPYPVVDFKREATIAREQFSQLAHRARKALDDPEVRRRASLSRRRRQHMNSKTMDENTASEQSDSERNQHRLEDFC